MSYAQRILDQEDFEKSKVHPVGRPPKLTSELIEEICNLVIQGKSIARSALARNVSESTIYRWIALGKKSDSDPIYKELVERLTESCELSEFEALQTIRRATSSPDNWRASAWILEHRFSEKYSKNNVNQAIQMKEPNSNPDDGTTGVLASIA